MGPSLSHDGAPGQWGVSLCSVHGSMMDGRWEKIQKDMCEAAGKIEDDDAGHDGTGAVGVIGDSIPPEGIEVGRGCTHAHTLLQLAQVGADTNGVPLTVIPKLTIPAQRFTQVAKAHILNAGARCSRLSSSRSRRAPALEFLGKPGDRNRIVNLVLGAIHVRVIPFVFIFSTSSD